MIHMPFRVCGPAVAVLLLVTAVPARSQQPGERDGNFFGGLFGGSERFRGSDRNESARGESPGQMAQASPPDLVVRLDRLENQIRQLTGLVEQLQFRNQQLEQQLRGMQGVGAGAAQGAGVILGAGAPPPGASPPPPRAQSVQPVPPLPGPPGPPQRRSDVYEPQSDTSVAVIPGNPAVAPAGPRSPAPQRRADVFDPNDNPGAVGAPRTLGTIPGSPNIIRGEPDDADGGRPIGAPGGRQAGAPLDLSTLSGHAANDPSLATPVPVQPGGALPPPPPRNPNATGTYQQQAMAPPATATPKEEYDHAYGSLVRKDYAVAEEGFRTFLRKNPSERLAGDATYWLGETLFQRQRYREAAESFLTVSTKFEKASKAPDALVRLGQSLAALKEKEAACATFSELARKYPRASPSVKQSVEREQKRVGC